MKKESQPVRLNILLADDDIDDCFFFKRALKDIPILNDLAIVNDGEELMLYLHEPLNTLPDIIFLDLSMPRKTGIECLNEINESEKFKGIDVVIFSTSFGRDIEYEQRLINMLSNMGARDFIRKPGDIDVLRTIIQDSLIRVGKTK